VDFDSVKSFSNLPINPIFPFQLNQIAFRWSGISKNSDKLQFSYLLEGSDRQWSPLILDNKVGYQDLRSGYYTFKIRAVGSNGIWSNIVTYSFTITPPLWKTNWAYLFYALLLFASLWSFIRWRTTTLKKRQKALEQTVSERTAELVAEQHRANDLLLNILPEKVAKELKATGQTKPVQFEEVNILFSDFKEFTNIVASIPGKKLVSELDDIFQHFDDIMDEVCLEKIQTIGDAYLAAGGLSKKDKEHAIKCIQAGKKMIEYLEERNQVNAIKWKVRVGIHSGPITAGVVGKKKFSYDLFGDTINIAARKESTSEEGRINVSAYTYDLIKDHFNCEYRGKINAKGKGDLDMYFVE
jgi:class 3 adenylate cyclase